MAEKWGPFDGGENGGESINHMIGAIDYNLQDFHHPPTYPFLHLPIWNPTNVDSLRYHQHPPPPVRYINGAKLWRTMVNAPAYHPIEEKTSFLDFVIQIKGFLCRLRRIE